MSLYIGIAIIVVAILVIIGIVMAVIGSRRRRSQQLRQQFGPEYDRTLQSAGNANAAERELQARRERRRSFQIRPLGAVERQRYTNEWMTVQQRFVDAPHQALAEADRLVGAVMGDRGYPMHDFEGMADDVSVDHPHEVNDYRQAHAVAESGDRASTEDMRVAMQRYRSLFDSLLREDTAEGREGARGPAPAATTATGTATGGPAGTATPAGGPGPGGTTAGGPATGGNTVDGTAAGGPQPGPYTTGGNSADSTAGTPTGEDR